MVRRFFVLSSVFFRVLNHVVISAYIQLFIYYICDLFHNVSLFLMFLIMAYPPQFSASFAHLCKFCAQYLQCALILAHFFRSNPLVIISQISLFVASLLIVHIFTAILLGLGTVGAYKPVSREAKNKQGGYKDGILLAVVEYRRYKRSKNTDYSQQSVVEYPVPRPVERDRMRVAPRERTYECVSAVLLPDSTKGERGEDIRMVSIKQVKKRWGLSAKDIQHLRNTGVYFLGLKHIRDTVVNNLAYQRTHNVLCRDCLAIMCKINDKDKEAQS